MKKLQLDTGVEEYALSCGGVLRFNPRDPGLYARLMEAMENLEALETDLARKAQALSPEDGAGALRLMGEADREARRLLTWIFGPDNDFGKLLRGVNLLAVGANGQRVLTNFFTAMAPVLTAGAEDCVRQESLAATQKANARRAGQ